MLLRTTGRLDEAEAMARRMVELADGLVADAPAARHYRYQWAASRAALADALARLRRPGEAEPTYRLALGAYEQLLRDFPADGQYRLRLGACSTRFGIFLAAAGRPDEAKAAYRRSLAVSPNDALACNNLAWLLANLDDPARADPAEAVSLAERAVKLAP